MKTSFPKRVKGNTYMNTLKKGCFQGDYRKINHDFICGRAQAFDPVNKPPSSPAKACNPHKERSRGVPVWAPEINTKFDLLV